MKKLLSLIAALGLTAVSSSTIVSCSAKNEQKENIKDTNDSTNNNEDISDGSDNGDITDGGEGDSSDGEGSDGDNSDGEDGDNSDGDNSGEDTSDGEDGDNSNGSDNGEDSDGEDIETPEEIKEFNVLNEYTFGVGTSYTITVDNAEDFRVINSNEALLDVDVINGNEIVLNTIKEGKCLITLEKEGYKMKNVSLTLSNYKIINKGDIESLEKTFKDYAYSKQLDKESKPEDIEAFLKTESLYKMYPWIKEFKVLDQDKHFNYKVKIIAQTNAFFNRGISDEALFETKPVDLNKWSNRSHLYITRAEDARYFTTKAINKLIRLHSDYDDLKLEEIYNSVVIQSKSNTKDYDYFFKLIPLDDENDPNYHYYENECWLVLDVIII